MESALHKAQSVFNEIKGKDFEYQNKVVTQLHALLYEDRRQRLLTGIDQQKNLIESLSGLNSFPLVPEHEGPVKSEQVQTQVPMITTEPTSNETTSDPS